MYDLVVFFTISKSHKMLETTHSRTVNVINTLLYIRSCILQPLHSLLPPSLSYSCTYTSCFGPVSIVVDSKSHRRWKRHISTSKSTVYAHALQEILHMSIVLRQIIIAFGFTSCCITLLTTPLHNISHGALAAVLCCSTLLRYFKLPINGT